MILERAWKGCTLTLPCRGAGRRGSSEEGNLLPLHRQTAKECRAYLREHFQRIVKPCKPSTAANNPPESTSKLWGITGQEPFVFERLADHSDGSYRWTGLPSEDGPREGPVRLCNDFQTYLGINIALIAKLSLKEHLTRYGTDASSLTRAQPRNRTRCIFRLGNDGGPYGQKNKPYRTNRKRLPSDILFMLRPMGPRKRCWIRNSPTNKFKLVDFRARLALSQRNFKMASINVNSNYRVVEGKFVGRVLGRDTFGATKEMAWSMLLLTKGFGGDSSILCLIARVSGRFRFDKIPIKRSGSLTGPSKQGEFAFQPESKPSFMTPTG